LGCECQQKTQKVRKRWVAPIGVIAIASLSHANLHHPVAWPSRPCTSPSLWGHRGSKRYKPHHEAQWDRSLWDANASKGRKRWVAPIGKVRKRWVAPIGVIAIASLSHANLHHPVAWPSRPCTSPSLWGHRGSKRYKPHHEAQWDRSLWDANASKGRKRWVAPIGKES
jgi:hypothetical protein